MSQNQASLLKDYNPLFKGFCAAIRSPEYFNFFDSLFTTMNDIQNQLTPGAGGFKNQTYFLDQIYQSKVISSIWLKIKGLYQRGYAPINQRPGSDLDISIEEFQHRELTTALLALFPPPDGLDEDAMAFTDLFRTRPYNLLAADFKQAREALEAACKKVANYLTPEDLKMQEINAMDALNNRAARMEMVDSIFARGAASALGGSSTEIRNMMRDRARHSRLKFLAGSGPSTIDDRAYGMHGKGLNIVIGGPSTGKSHVMSSIAENHIYEVWRHNRLCEQGVEGLLPREYPHIWGYILEDGVDEYERRIICKFINRPDVREAYGFKRMSLYEFSDAFTSGEDVEFCAKVDVLLDEIVKNCLWLRSPDDPDELLNFNTVSMIHYFNQIIDSDHIKPKMVIIDYFNLLALPRNRSSGNIAKDLSIIGHLLDEWGDSHNVPIISAMQSSVIANNAARMNLDFLELDSMHESKSISHHARFVFSILPFDDYDENNNKIHYMGIKILKNRGAKKDMLFICGNDYATNTILVDSREVTEIEWAVMRNNIMAKKQQITNSQTPGGGQQGGQNQPRRNGQRGFTPAPRSRPQAASGQQVMNSPSAACGEIK